MGTWKWKHTEDFAFSQVPRLSQASGVDAEYFSLSQCPEARCVLCSIVAQNCSDLFSFAACLSREKVRQRLQSQIDAFLSSDSEVQRAALSGAQAKQREFKLST